MLRPGSLVRSPLCALFLFAVGCAGGTVQAPALELRAMARQSSRRSQAAHDRARDEQSWFVLAAALSFGFDSVRLARATRLAAYEPEPVVLPPEPPAGCELASVCAWSARAESEASLRLDPGAAP